MKNPTKERMPDIAFRAMTFIFNVMDFIYPRHKKLNHLKIKKGDNVIDYGCGPGGYLKRASELVGDSGQVIAIDIHELAIKSVEKLIQKHDIKNVKTVKANGYSCNVKDNVADVIYAFDMFHMIEEPKSFLKELHRLVKQDGKLYIDDGHQPRKKTIDKINNTGLWKIIKEDKHHLECVPV